VPFEKAQELSQGLDLKKGVSGSHDQVVARAAELDLVDKPGRAKDGLTALGAGQGEDKTPLATEGPELPRVQVVLKFPLRCDFG
jgi:hypothetical protein